MDRNHAVSSIHNWTSIVITKILLGRLPVLKRSQLIRTRHEESEYEQNFIGGIILDCVSLGGQLYGQTLQSAQALFAECKWALAREEAIQVYNSTNDLDALRLYIRAALPSGKAAQALPHAEYLWQKGGIHLDQALYVKTMFCAGDLSGARNEASQMLLNISAWQADEVAIKQIIDICMERTIQMDFRFRQSEVDFQSHLAPYIHVPIPIPSMINQTSFINDAINFRDFQEVTQEGTDFVRSAATPSTLTRMKTMVMLSPVDVRKDLAKSDWGYPASESVYVEPRNDINSDHPDIIALTTVLSDPDRPPVETINSVLSWCQENINYISPNAPYNGWGTATEIIDRGWGHCHDQATVAATLLRACDIPARLVRGHSAVRGDSGAASHHTILEFYTTETGWITWDYSQTPGVIGADFLAMWRYGYRQDYANLRLKNELWNFHSVQASHPYAWFNVISRN